MLSCPAPAWPTHTPVIAKRNEGWQIMMIVGKNMWISVLLSQHLQTLGVFKITTRGKNENTDHRVTAPLIPRCESRRPKWSDYYKGKGPALLQWSPRRRVGGGGGGVRLGGFKWLVHNPRLVSCVNYCRVIMWWWFHWRQDGLVARWP